MSAAPSVSPDASPATRAMRNRDSRLADQRTRLRVDSPMKSTKVFSSGWVAARALSSATASASLRSERYSTRYALLEVADLLGREAAALEPFGIDRVRHGRVPDRHDVRRHVARHRRIVADERVRADLAELVDAASSRP